MNMSERVLEFVENAGSDPGMVNGVFGTTPQNGASLEANIARTIAADNCQPLDWGEPPLQAYPAPVAAVY